MEPVNQNIRDGNRDWDRHDSDRYRRYPYPILPPPAVLIPEYIPVPTPSPTPSPPPSNPQDNNSTNILMIIAIIIGVLILLSLIKRK
jgi:hypothetical protein